MKIDNTLYNALRARMPAALAPLEAELGIKINLGRGTMDRSHKMGTLKLELLEVGENGETETPESLAFKQLAAIYGLKAEDLGREFTTTKGTRHKIIGLRPKARKQPILTKDTTTLQEYVWPASTVAGYLKDAR